MVHELIHGANLHQRSNEKIRPQIHLSSSSPLLIMSGLSPSSSHDKEKGVVAEESTVHAAEADPEEVLVKRYGRLGPLLAKLFANGVEARGVERVPEDQRETKNMWNK